MWLYADNVSFLVQGVDQGEVEKKSKKANDCATN